MEAATIKIEQSIIDSIIRAEVQAAIAGALGKREDLIKDIVSGALAIKVDADGRPDRGGYYDSRTYLEYFVNKAIQEAAKEAFTEYLTEMKPKLRAELVKQIKKQTSAETLAGVVMDGLTHSLESSWLVNVNLKLKNTED